MQNWSNDPLELKAWLAVGRLPRVGAVSFQKLLKQNILPQQLFSFSAERLQNLGLGKEAISLLQTTSLSQLEALEPLNSWLEGVQKDINWAEHPDHHIVCFHDPRYPFLLKEIHDPPPFLFVAGDPEFLSVPQIAVIGSRNPSQAGLSNTRNFSRYLAQNGLLITSGLAAGIDGEAHQAALDAGGFTIAVAGHGLDHLYPRQHLNLARAICKAGAVISEYPIGTQPRPQLFPRRNRIISGLSYGVLVVEAALKSGSLITARMALEQGREVFAIPGSIHHPLSRGCHSLIKQGATLVESGEDMFNELQGFAALSESMPDVFTPQPAQSPGEAGKEAEPAASPKKASLIGSSIKNPTQQQAPAREPQQEEGGLLACLDYDPMPIDLIIERSGLSAGEVASALVLLELKGSIIEEAGGYCKKPRDSK
ncbi:MAG: DNA-protecting protein DprA [Pseudomonadales bacterium]|nr:DNA-protecting protein DprA [Pseudomonadales bacterium]